jgi:hypothetical protein
VGESRIPFAKERREKLLLLLGSVFEGRMKENKFVKVDKNSG